MENAHKVLAVDDEKFNLLLLQSCLKGEPFDITLCSNALDALDQFKKDSFDVVLLDIMMSGIDGFELRRLIREINKRVPIIFLTSLVDDINSTMLGQIASDQYCYYMHKSFTKQELIKKLTDAIVTFEEHKQSQEYINKIQLDLKLAGDVQKIMLPQWCVADEDFASSFLYKPALQVSGDMLEIFPLGNHRTLFFIGDIAGHGIQAALYMSAILSFLKTYLFQNMRSDLYPHDILNRLDSFFQDELAMKNYMTCLVGIFDFEQNHLSFHSAGHPGIILCDPQTGTAKVLASPEKGGLPVGLFRGSLYLPEGTEDVDFKDDDIFLMHTDGINDICNSAGGTLDDNLLLSMVGGLSQDSQPVLMPYRLYNSLEQIGYSKNPDDICVMALQKTVQSNYHFRRVIPADINAVRGCAESCAAFVKENAHDEHVADKVELLLNEFLNNIIVHGLKDGRYLQARICIGVRILEDGVRIRVLDCGQNWNVTQNFSSAEEILDRKNAERAISGRGLAIIHKLVSTISRNHYSGLNETSFFMKKGE